jgi:hypothetical protein
MKCHLKTRDGWMKTIDHSGTGDTRRLVVPRSHPIDTRPHNSDRWHPVDTHISALHFELVMEASVYDHRTNATVREAWYEER